LCTAGSWWAPHALYGAGILYLLPAAAILGFVRDVRGSVRATVVIHVAHNAVVAILGPAALLMD
jgi:membrane protease YdiL (CAAX protease family)